MWLTCTKCIRVIQWHFKVDSINCDLPYIHFGVLKAAIQYVSLILLIFLNLSCSVHFSRLISLTFYLCLKWSPYWDWSSDVYTLFVPFLVVFLCKRESKSPEILMYNAIQCCDITMRDCTQSDYGVQSCLVTSHHCLASFRRQTNIKISCDLATLLLYIYCWL